MSMTLGEIAELVGGRLAGDGSVRITGVAGLAEAGPGDLSFLANARYRPHLATTRAGGVLLRAEEARDCPRPSVAVDQPDWAFSVAAERLGPPPPRPRPGVHPLAFCAPGARIAAGAAVGPFAVVEEGAVVGGDTVVFPHVYVGAEAVVGRGCLLYPGVVLRERVRLGDRVILHGGVIVGGDGFGYATVGGVHRKIPQLGTVVIEDDVELGANTTVDRARFGETRIRRGTKIDNLVQVAHNVEIGEHGLIASQTGIAGSAKIGNRVMMGGKAGVAGHVEIADGIQVAGGAGVTKGHPAGAALSGIPARPIAQYRRAQAALQRLPELVEEVRRLRREIETLKNRSR
jgi:UDP-3-O-[3-hydroxymyristoyl] glucosamine N-acyltransferase